MGAEQSSTMNVDILLLRNFMKYFVGSTTHYGSTTLSDAPEAGKKREAVSTTVKGAPEIREFAAHLNGTRGLGLAPLMDVEYVRFAVIDIDIYDAGVRNRIIRAIKDSQLPLIPALSKSGGLHLYVFFVAPEKAIDVREMLSETATIFALDYYGKTFDSAFDKTEIFPKQNIETVANGSNWINLPYFNYNETDRPILDENGTPLDVYDAIELIERRATTLKAYKVAMSQIDGFDGPPCLQHIRLFHDLGESDGRNNFIFSLARYYKLSDDPDIENELISANADLDAPLPTSELKATLNSALKTDASYLCSKSPLCNLCNRKLCVKREFGISNTAVSNYSFGQLTVIMSDPPVYKWSIDDQIFEFYDESEIIDQHYWQRMALRKLHKLPRMLKQEVWGNIINRAFENKAVEYPEAGLGDSAGELLMSLVTSFMTSRGTVDEMSLVLHGAVFHNHADEHYYFKMEYLFKYLKNNNLSLVSVAQLSNKLAKDYNAGPRRVSTKATGQFRCWAIPVAALVPWMKPEAEDVDFEKLAEEVGKDAGF